MSIETSTPLPLVPTAPPSATSMIATPQTVTIPLDQLNTFAAMQARLAKVEEEQQQRDEEARVEQIKVLAAKGQVEEALRAQREQAEKDINAERAIRVQVEERAKRYALDGELARELGSKPLVAGGGEQLTQLWRDQFLVEPAGNSFQVRTPDFRSVGDFIAVQLSRPEYAHFLRAQNPSGGIGGSTGVQAVQTSPTNPIPAAQPKNMSEAIILGMLAAKKDSPDARVTMGQAVGLRPLAKQA